MKILLYDLEISPILGWTYEMWDTRVLRVEKEPQIMSVSWKWLGDRHIDNDNIENDTDDEAVCGVLWELMNDADVVVAHNAKKFDNRVAAARFMAHGFPPPSPYKTVDTLIAARRFFRFPSNSLNDLCHQLGLGTKPKTTHASLWHDCLNGDTKAWRKMVKYNNNDVLLLEKLYLKLRPYITNHPNVTVNKDDGCPRCGSKNTEWRGFYYTNTTKYHRFVCNDCGAWSKERLVAKDENGKAHYPTKVAAV